MALYHPILSREKEGVGDVGFFDADGKWIAICNAFDTEVHLILMLHGLTKQGLVRMHLPTFQFSEAETVVTENPVARNFKVGVGGNFKSEYRNFGVEGDVPVLAAPG
jgi:hypothetical protein